MLEKVAEKAAMYSFIVFLLLASTFTFLRANIPGSWLVPAIMVFIYGLVLYVIQRKGKPLLSHEKDSPYIMGFILTLVALLNTFFDIPNITAADHPLIYEKIGIALSTTIAGLCVRYFIIVSDSTEKKQSELLQILAEQQEKTLLSYLDAQENLLGLVSSFSKDYQDLIHEEMVRHKSFIEALREMETEVSSMYDTLKCRIESTSDLLSTEASSLERVLSKSTQNISRSCEYFQGIQQEFAQVVINSNKQLKSFDFQSWISLVQHSSSTLSEAMQNMSSRIENDVTSLNSNIVSSFREVNKAVRTLSQQTDNLGTALSNAKTKIEVATEEIISERKEGILRTHNDVKIIDQLLTDFTETVKKHIAGFGNLSKHVQ